MWPLSHEFINIIKNPSSCNVINLKYNSVTIHVRNLRILTTELYKTKANLAAPIMHEIFEQRNIHYNLRSQTDFQLGPVKTVNSGLRALRYLGPKIWNILPFQIKFQRFLHNSRWESSLGNVRIVFVIYVNLIFTV